jgi:MerR family redox-sensitive transcriptional activator SoxR
MPDERLTIGELSRATGVATSALRYWEQLGLLPAPERASGQRRYPAGAVRLVGTVLLLRDTGFTLREIAEFLASRSAGWRDLARRKVDELDERIARAHAARTALAHALACRHDDLGGCPTHADVVTARLAGSPLHEAHRH